ncbi:unnamed protein product [Leptosia nina]|uniref:Uncharacterized protein n=1 Tax=Leptosia nina TaxID=320188 RepID=A0AAV1JYY2_9NEOP
MGTEAACVLECRRRATIALCSCVPFNMQPQEGEKVCSPEHLYCLNKHREKLTYYNPGSAADSTLDNEKSNGVKCLHCRPDCRHVTFSAAPAHVPYDYAPLKKLFRNKLLDGVTFTNSTVIRIFYASEDDQIVHILETNLRLYEDIALLGSQWILLCGASLICLNELVYFSTIRWAYHYFRRRRIEGTTLNFTFSY